MTLSDKPQDDPLEAESQKNPVNNRKKKERSIFELKMVVSGSIILLIFQLLLGMWTNLFATFPTPVQSVNPIDQIFTEGPPLLALHVVVGILLGLLSIIGLVGSAYLKNMRLIVLQAFALVSVLIAGESGVEFVLGGYQENILSFTMTVGFAMLLATYIWISRKM